jgi:hypothetical protein
VSNFKSFTLEIGDFSVFNEANLTINLNFFNVKIGNNCSFDNYVFYNNSAGFKAVIGDNATFGKFAFNDTISGLIDLKIGNYLTSGTAFFKNNYTNSNFIKIGNNSTIGALSDVSLSSNNNLTAVIGDFFVGKYVFVNGGNENVTIGNFATITDGSFYDSGNGKIHIGEYLTADNFFIDSSAKSLKIESILSLSNAFNNFAGRITILSYSSNNGFIGTTIGQDFTNCFGQSQKLILILPTETQTCNNGNPDGDVQVAIANGIDINNNLRYIL